VRTEYGTHSLPQAKSGDIVRSPTISSNAVASQCEFFTRAGYTHLGRDIDGEQWGDEAFQESELDIVEGLAQFYTEVVTARIAAQTPGPLAAYKKFLALQVGPYRAHENWVKTKPSQKGEIVRFAMVATRKPTFPIWVSPRTDPGSECFLFQQFAPPPCLSRGDSSTFSSLRPRFRGSYTWNMLL